MYQIVNHTVWWTIHKLPDQNAALSYVLCFIGNAFVDYFRGVGRVLIPFLGTTLHLTLRVVLSWLSIGRLRLSAVAAATGAGWILVVNYYFIILFIKWARNDSSINHFVFRD